MLNITAHAKLLAITPRKEFHGDDSKKAVTLSLVFADLPTAMVEAGFIAQMGLFYDANDTALPDVAGIDASREVQNVDVTIGRLKLRGFECDKVKIKPRARRTAEVRLKLKGVIQSGLDSLHEYLNELVKVSLEEQAPDIQKLEGGIAPSEDPPQSQAA